MSTKVVGNAEKALAKTAARNVMYREANLRKCTHCKRPQQCRPTIDLESGSDFSMWSKNSGRGLCRSDC